MLPMKPDIQDRDIEQLVQNLAPYDMPHVQPDERDVAIRLVCRIHESLLSASTPEQLATAATVVC